MEKRKAQLFLVFLVGKLLLQFFSLHPDYDLHRDEFLHLNFADHLAWGYFSVPPFIAGVAYLIKLLGNDPFWVHLFPALAGCLTLYWVWKWVEEESGDLYALCLAGVLVLFSPLLRINGLFQPNSFDILFWTGTYYYLSKYFRSLEPRYLYLAGAALGLGILNKYNIAFLIFGLIPSILLFKRELFREKHFYGALGFVLLIVLPNLLWQLRHEMPVLEHMRLLRTYHLVHVHYGELFFELLLYAAGALPFVISLRKLKRSHFWLVSAILISILFFVYFNAKPYYLLGMYPIFWGLCALYFAEITKRKWKWALLLWPICLISFAANDFLPIDSAEVIIAKGKKHKWEDATEHPIPQDFADMLGWKELAEKTEKVLRDMPDSTLVFCDNYGQAGAINYYSKGSVNAQGFDGDFGAWLDTETPYKHLVRIVSVKNRVEEYRATLPIFEHGELRDSISNPIAREYRTGIYVYKNARVSINNIIKKEQKEEVYRGLLKK